MTTVTVLGSINMDIVMQVDSLPRPGETTLVKATAHHPGGKGANQAVAAARMGARVAMLGAVGRDAFGDRMVDVLVDEGIDISGIARLDGQPTGTAHIAVDREGENLILVTGGANRHVTAESSRGAVHIAQLETPMAAVEQFLKAAKIAILNAAPFVAEARALFALCDIVIVNEVELAGYAGTNGDDILAAARSLVSRADQAIIVTLGAKGAVAVMNDSVSEVPAIRAEVIDTTGAGDCFCGVLAASIGDGLPLEDAMRRAVHAAAIAVGKAGAIPSLPFAKDLI